jgi:hypothetical protein
MQQSPPTLTVSGLQERAPHSRFEQNGERNIAQYLREISNRKYASTHRAYETLPEPAPVIRTTAPLNKDSFQELFPLFPFPVAESPLGLPILEAPRALVKVSTIDIVSVSTCKNLQNALAYLDLFDECRVDWTTIALC